MSGGSKTATRSLLGPPEPSWGSFWPSWSSFLASWGSVWASWGSPGAPGSLWGAAWGLQKGSRRLSRRPPSQKLDFRSNLGSILAPFLNPPDLENQGFRVERLHFSDNREVRKTSKNLAIMEREARETRERASNASKARAERAARTARAGATRQGTEARREWREPPEDRNSKPVRSPTPLLGRFAAYAGGLRWECVSVTSFLWRPCAKPMEICRKSSKNNVRRV